MKDLGRGVVNGDGVGIWGGMGGGLLAHLL